MDHPVIFGLYAINTFEISRSSNSFELCREYSDDENWITVVITLLFVGSNHFCTINKPPPQLACDWPCKKGVFFMWTYHYTHTNLSSGPGERGQEWSKARTQLQRRKVSDPPSKRARRRERVAKERPSHRGGATGSSAGGYMKLTHHVEAIANGRVNPGKAWSFTSLITLTKAVSSTISIMNYKYHQPQLSLSIIMNQNYHNCNLPIGNQNHNDHNYNRFIFIIRDSHIMIITSLFGCFSK